MEGRPLEDAELVERARQGDVGSYEELVRRYQDVAGRTAYVITGRAADAQDAVQEAFVKAYRSLGRFRTDRSFRPWLLRIVANEAITRRRASTRGVALALRAAEGRPEGDAAPSPEGAALERERQEEVLAAVRRLRPEDRLVAFERDGVRWADGTAEPADAVLWATGFRAALDHLAPLHLRAPGGGIALDGTQVLGEPRLHLVGYGPSASTVGATRAGRAAAVALARTLRTPAAA
jgi:RNA polymerase sigma factor (sigma-70 family)